MGRHELFNWLGRPRNGVHELVDTAWRFRSFAELEASMYSVATGLRELRVASGDRVGIATEPGTAFMAALFGIWLRGAVAVPIAPAAAFVGTGDQGEQVRRAVDTTGIRLVVGGGAGPTGVPGPMWAPVEELLDVVPEEHPLDLGATLVLQLTSGTTGPPKAVRVTCSSLEAQVAAMVEWLSWTSDDIGASWLPMHHDMGLVSFLASLSAGASSRIMRPADFIRKPVGWLRCFGEDGAVLAPSPVFGLDHVVRRVRPHHLDGLDLSSWRALIVGAERIDPRVLARFVELLAPHGFSPNTIVPAYGMAETTLAITGSRPGAPVRVSVPDSTVAVDLFGGDRAETAKLAHAVVSCGEPVTGMEIEIVSEEGVPLPDGAVGEIIARGSSVAGGYTGDAGRSETEFHGRVATGDDGFMLDGSLFVIGRAGDSLKINGQAVHAEDLELAVGAVSGVPARRYCVLLGQGIGPPTAVVVSDRSLPVEPVTRVVRRVLGPGPSIEVLKVPRGAMLWTTSGKPRRRALWRAYERGALASDDRSALGVP